MAIVAAHAALPLLEENKFECEFGRFQNQETTVQALSFSPIDGHGQAMPRSSLVARQMAFRLPLLPLQASHRQQRWPTILALLFLGAPFPRSPGTFVLFGAIELRIARLNLLHSGIGAFPEIAGRGKARGFSLQSRGAYTRIAATAPSFAGAAT